MKRYTKRGGFTLIELLVVIAIIGILASVVLVSLNSARSKGKDVRIISDVQQVRTALESGYTGSAWPDLKQDNTATNGGVNGNATNCVTNGWNNQGVQNTALNAVISDACTQGGVNSIVINTNNQATPNSYSIWGKLPSNSSGGTYFCIDSTGKTNAADNATFAATCH